MLHIIVASYRFPRVFSVSVPISVVAAGGGTMDTPDFDIEAVPIGTDVPFSTLLLLLMFKRGSS